MTRRRWLPWTFLAASILAAVIGQVLGKYGAFALEAGEGWLNPFVLSGYGLLFLRGILWLFALRGIPLIVAYPLTSLTFVAVLVASVLLFGESLTPARLLGMVAVTMGVWILARAKARA